MSLRSRGRATIVRSTIARDFWSPLLSFIDFFQTSSEVTLQSRHLDESHMFTVLAGPISFNAAAVRTSLASVTPHLRHQACNNLISTYYEFTHRRILPTTKAHISFDKTFKLHRDVQLHYSRGVPHPVSSKSTLILID